ncbi:response regulator [Frankia sp. AgB1.9]|uniref:response regulator n=1 Tax=unclassified Frankia TaxID=2632575 RepID=UPI001934568C|nr:MULTISPECIES: response regulator [unclassified Frankia]MBL7490945.1 response regulator [Frankia sp. AgW1.1]MBL7550893.1 response regulator [Frankia sp. AgB1.9]MBL7621303.1 response regulator [Frankia sp. AgB1.8]
MRAIGTRPYSPGRALIVDDNDMIRTLVSRLLSHDGHEVDAAASVEDALAFPVADYHTLIIDVRLGAERGTDLIERLRSQDPSMPARCLLLTGGIDDDLPPDVAVLYKPFTADDLSAAVRALGDIQPSGASPR